MHISAYCSAYFTYYVRIDFKWREEWVVIDIIYNNINSFLTDTFVNRFSTSSEANIPLLGLCVCRIQLNSCVNFMLYLLGMKDIYIYIYIYIYILSSTDRCVSFYQNSSVWLDRLDSRSWDRNPVDSNANPRFYHSATRKPAPAK